MSKQPGNRRQGSFSATIRPQLESMYRFAYRLTGHREDAQDLVQDVLLKLHQRPEQLASVDAPGSYVRRALYHQHVDNQRRNARSRFHVVQHEELSSNPDYAPAPEATPEQVADGEFTIRRLQAALSRLSDDHRLIISLHDVEGYTLTEMAEITGIPLGTLKSRRHRARERLQKILDEGPKSPVSSSRESRGEKNDALRPVPTPFGTVS